MDTPLLTVARSPAECEAAVVIGAQRTGKQPSRGLNTSDVEANSQGFGE